MYIGWLYFTAVILHNLWVEMFHQKNDYSVLWRLLKKLLTVLLCLDIRFIQESNKTNQVEYS